jgi:hypothetical protein
MRVMKLMKRLGAVAMAVGVASSMSYGQALPAGVAAPLPSWSPNLPSFAGTLHYSLSAFETVQEGFYNGQSWYASTGFSGNVGYSSTSERFPFSMLYAGGVYFPDSSSPGQQGATTFQDIVLSQTILAGRWMLNVSDSLSYLPESPTTGLSGVAGVGDIGSFPVSGPSIGPAGGVLTNTGSRIGNSLSGGASRQLTGATSLSANGSWGVLHFLDDNGGIDSTQVSGEVGVNHRLDARDSVGANGVYSSYTYGGVLGDFHSYGVNATFQRSLSRSLSASVSAGPAWIAGSTLQSSVIFSGTANLTYTRKYGNFALGYNHGVNAGSGVQPGAVSDNIYLSASHSFTQEWLGSASTGYSHTDGLQLIQAVNYPTGSISTFFGGLQVTRMLSRRFSAYASYTAQQQSFSQSLAGQNAFNGVGQTFGIGISYTPQSTQLGQF